MQKTSTQDGGLQGVSLKKDITESTVKNQSVWNLVSTTMCHVRQMAVLRQHPLVGGLWFMKE